MPNRKTAPSTLQAAISEYGKPSNLRWAEEIDRALELKEGFKGLFNVVDALLPALDELDRSSLAPERYAGWKETLSEANTIAHTQKWTRLAHSVRAGNPLGGSFKTYPIPSLLLQPPADISGGQAKAILQLVIDSILADPAPLDHKIATDLRRAISPNPAYLSFLQSLPKYQGTRASLDDLRDYLTGLNPKTIPAPGNSVILAVCSLQKLSPSNSKTAGESEHPPEPKKKPLPPGRPRLQLKLPDFTPSPPKGQVGIYTHPVDKDAPGEPPGTDLIHEQEPESEPDAETPTTGDLDADARESRRWTTAHQAIVPNTYARLTPIERRHFVQEIKSRLASDNAAQQRTAGLIALMYLLGRDLDSVLSISCGSLGELTREGLYRREIRLPADGYSPPGNLQYTMTPRSEILELELPSQMASWASKHIGTEKGTLTRHLGIHSDQAKDEVKSAMDDIRQNTLFQRIRQERISAALNVELAVSFHDPVITHHLCGTPAQAPPVLSYYISHDIQRIRHAYRLVSQRLIDEPSSPPYSIKAMASIQGGADSVTGHYPSLESRQRLAKGASADLRQLLDARDGLIERHNAFVDHCLALLFRATGHRAVRDPFPSLRHIDMERGLLLVQDKVVTESRQWRLVALAPLACEQLHHYLTYLKALTNRIKDDSRTRLPQWIKDVPAILAGRDTPTPLFFYLSPELECQSVTPGTLDKRWYRHWPLPTRLIRHVLATELYQSCHSADLVQIQLGHTEGLNHPLGATSTRSALDQLAEIAQHVQRTLVAEGWSAIKPPLRYTGNRPPIQPKAGGAKNSDIHNAHHRRARIRKERLSKIASRLRDMVEKFRNGLHSWEKVDAEEFKALTQEILNDAKAQGYSPNHALRMLHRLVRTQPGGNGMLRRATHVRVLEPDPSPFHADTLYHYAAALKLRDQFLSYLDTQGKTRREFDVDIRIAEIIMSATLFSGISDPALLGHIPSALFNRLYRYGEQLFIDLPWITGESDEPVYRWFPDPVSRSLIIGMTGHAPDPPEWIADPKQTSEHAQTLLFSLTGQKRINFSLLLRYAQAAGTIELPGYIYAALCGDVKIVSLPLRAWYRILSDLPLSLPEQARESEDAILERLLFDIRQCNPGVAKGERSLFKKQLTLHFNKTQALPITGNSRPNRKRKSTLARALENELMTRPHKWSQLPSLIATWGIALCRSGTPSKRNLAFSTIRKYVPLVSDALLRPSITTDFLNLTDVAYEEHYSSILYSKPAPMRPMLYGRLQAFHDFLVNQYQIEEPDWTAIRNAAGAQIQPQLSDANYLTDKEYLHILDTLITASDLSTRARIRCAWLVFLGFRFGVRFGEAWRLQYREVQYDATTSEMCIWIRNSAQGEVKTVAGSRVIPLLESLTETEISILKDILQYGEQGFTNNPLFPLMSETTTHCTLDNHHIIVKHIHIAMRSITGDPNIRFHHLRHSWATRLFAYTHFRDMGHEIGEAVPFIPKQATLQATQEYFGSHDNDRHLKSISTAMGHATEITSLTSYGHSLDTIAASIAQRRAPTLSDHAMAYTTGTVHATVRSRRRRSRDNLSLAMNCHADARINLPPVETMETRDDVKVSFQSDSRDSITLPEIDLLLCLYGSSNLGVDVLAKMLHITSGMTQRIITKATNTERASGFDKYNLTTTLRDPLIQSAMADSSLSNGYLSTLETKRSRNYLRDLTTWLEELPFTDMQTLKQGLDAWSRSYTPDDHALIVTSIQDARCLVQYYELLPDTLTGSFRLPTDYETSAALLNDLRELGWPIEGPHAKVRRAPAKSSRLRRARVELRLTQIAPQLKTTATVHRVSYLLSVFLQITGAELDTSDNYGITSKPAQ
ncbi:hypothetical protein LRB11_13110 [Ectothiorhodospira haloalkaliphila]|uniref:tyrosine-type recombinase/integrase n=1 Tax=Ectothiorhodospira haloalkaliphila TaxID=421628 RepID=UPI001EE7BDD2|nr:tyrosine-type recombinase/integrase [Ectothiorhodospira haloalkaliphila]MCG5525860.1 hypothetical protein [Ectothiorhodospira haloalkaliphila]